MHARPETTQQAGSNPGSALRPSLLQCTDPNQRPAVCQTFQPNSCQCSSCKPGFGPVTPDFKCLAVSWAWPAADARHRSHVPGLQVPTALPAPACCPPPPAPCSARTQCPATNAKLFPPPLAAWAAAHARSVRWALAGLPAATASSQFVGCLLGEALAWCSAGGAAAAGCARLELPLFPAQVQRRRSEWRRVHGL